MAVCRFDGWVLGFGSFYVGLDGCVLLKLVGLSKGAVLALHIARPGGKSVGATAEGDSLYLLTLISPSDLLQSQCSLCLLLAVVHCVPTSPLICPEPIARQWRWVNRGRKGAAPL